MLCLRLKHCRAEPVAFQLWFHTFLNNLIVCRIILVFSITMVSLPACALITQHESWKESISVLHFKKYLHLSFQKWVKIISTVMYPNILIRFTQSPHFPNYILNTFQTYRVHWAVQLMHHSAFKSAGSQGSYIRTTGFRHTPFYSFTKL